MRSAIRKSLGNYQETTQYFVPCKPTHQQLAETRGPEANGQEQAYLRKNDERTVLENDLVDRYLPDHGISPTITVILYHKIST